MSVSERRMFCLIWLLGGGGIGVEGGADAAGCGGLEEEDEWLEDVEETGDDGTLEDDEDWLWDEVSFCWCCFLGMVKLDLVTLSAPVTWMGPGGKEDWAWAVFVGFLDFAAVLLGGVAGFLEAFELVDWGGGFLPFGEPLLPLATGDFLFPFTGVMDKGADFSGAMAASFSLCSFSFCFSSLGGAGNQAQDQTI